MPTKDTTPFDAAAARKQTQQAQSITGAYLRAETDDIINAIKSASAAGKTSISTSRTNSVIQKRLTALGFTVVFVPGYDQREPEYLTVSW